MSSAADQPHDRILLIDDERSLLDGLVRVHGRNLNLVAEQDPERALEIVATQGPFAAVFCDYRMPKMNGGACLERLQQLAPDTVRVMLTGNSDLDTAIDAINRGAVFRFLRKPCDRDTFAACAAAALRMHRLLLGERDLLERTFKSSIQVLSDVLSITNADAFGRAGRVQHYVKQLIGPLRVADAWQVESAALLSQIGFVGIPQDIVQSLARKAPLTPQQRAIVGRHPKIGSDLLRNIPRLDEVARMVLYQTKRFDGGGLPTDSVAGAQIPLGARILAAAIAFEALLSNGVGKAEALAQMTSQRGVFDPQVLEQLANVHPQGAEMRPERLPVQRLLAGHVLEQDIVHQGGALIVAKGQVITESMLARLRSYADLGTIKLEFDVLVPAFETTVPV
jgi:response regulator RpfG family c-di-GMP phosphodiesterase